MLSAGASANVRDDLKASVDATWGYTPLHAAAFHSNLTAAAVLLKHATDVTVRDEKHHGTPAGWANYAGHTSVRDLILQGPVDIMEAVKFSLHERILAILHQDPDAINRRIPTYAQDWYTPLAFAVLRGQLETVRLLLDNGANPSLSAPDDQRLLDIAKDKGYEEIAALLNNHTG